MRPLDVRSLFVEYMTLRGWISVVEDANISMDSGGEILGLVGESGCGKTTLGLTIAGLLPPNARARGSVLVAGKDVLRNRNSAKVAMIFQDALASLNPVMTVGEQIAEVFVYHEGLSKKEALEKAKEHLREVGLPEDFVSRYPHELSGGQRQRALIAMALALRPDLIVADEPTTALDVTVQAKVLMMLKETVKRRSIPMVYITHDLALALQMCETIAVMYAGQIVEEAERTILFETPLHPYTRALLSSVPRVDADVGDLYVLEGEPPMPGSFPRGCRFHPRCPLAFARCKEDSPELVEAEKEHRVRCHLYARR